MAEICRLWVCWITKTITNVIEAVTAYNVVSHQPGNRLTTPTTAQIRIPVAATIPALECPTTSPTR